MTPLSAEFVAIATEAGTLADREADLDVETLSALESAAKNVERSWSNSSLGYQANVYYADFKVPPGGHMFSREWGFLGKFHGTVGDWRTYDSDDVVAHVQELAGNPDLTFSRDASKAVRGPVNALIEGARSVAARINPPHDDYVTENLEELQRISLPSVSKLAASLMNVPRGQLAIRDGRALEGGW